MIRVTFKSNKRFEHIFPKGTFKTDYYHINSTYNVIFFTVGKHRGAIDIQDIIKVEKKVKSLTLEETLKLYPNIQQYSTDGIVYMDKLYTYNDYIDITHLFKKENETVK